MDFEIPKDIREFLEKVDAFIEAEIKPLEQENDNIRFLDYRREDSRTDWDRGGLPNHEWELLMAEARRRADAAGLYRYSWPKEYGGQEGSNLGMAIIREHLAAKGLGLHCDLQTEHTIVGNSLGLQLMGKYGTDAAEGRVVAEDGRDAGRVCLRHHRAQPRHRCHLHGDKGLSGRGRVGHQRQQDLEHRAARRHPRPHLRPHERGARPAPGYHCVHRPDRHPGVQGRRVPLDLQHADRSCDHLAHQCAESTRAPSSAGWTTPSP